MSNLSYHQPKMELEPNKLLSRTIYAHQGYVSSVAFFGPQCEQLITGSYDETAKLWDLKTGLHIQKFQGHTDGVTFVLPGPDGCVLSASEDRTLRVWDADTGECLRVIRSHSGAVTSLCMAGPDRIVTGSSDKKLRVFDITGHLCGETELDSEVAAVTSPPPLVPRHQRNRLSASRSGGRGSVGSGGGRAKRKGDMVKQLFTSSSDGGDAFSSPRPPPTPPVVRVLACGGTHIPAPPRPMLRSVDVRTKPKADAIVQDDDLVRPSRSNLCTRRSEYEDNSQRAAAKEAGVMTCVAISAAGARGRGILVTGSYDRRVRVLHNVLLSDRDKDPLSASEDTDTAPPLASSAPAAAIAAAAAAAAPPPPPVTMRLLGRHDDGVRAVAISADGRWAVSGDREGGVKVWEVLQEAAPATDRPLCEPEAEFEAHKGYVFALCMSPNARTLVSGGSDKAVRVWDLSLIVYARRMALNRLRALWTTGRLRRGRQTRNSSSSSSNYSLASPRRSGGGGGGGGKGGLGGGAWHLKALGTSREQRQQTLESLFALPDIIYAKVLMFV